MADWDRGHDDFEPGNTAALVHGAHSERVVAAKCEELSPGFDEWISVRAPWATAAEFGPMRLNYLRSLAIVELLSADILATAAAEGSASIPTRRFETMLSALRNEREALEQLGLTPPTKVNMARTVAGPTGSLADIAADGKQARQQVTK
jgi:hypothetical protein